jgi:hypothetical protein
MFNLSFVFDSESPLLPVTRAFLPPAELSDLLVYRQVPFLAASCLLGCDFADHVASSELWDTQGTPENNYRQLKLVPRLFVGPLLVLSWALAFQRRQLVSLVQMLTVFFATTLLEFGLNAQ